jgi:hypothetical protein
VRIQFRGSKTVRRIASKKRLCQGKDLKRRYESDAHARKTKLMESAIYVVMRLTLNYKKFGMVLHQVRSRSL